MLIYLIVAIGIISYLIDRSKNPNFVDCKNVVSVNILLLIHHLLFSFMILGLLSNNIRIVKIYACTMGVIFLSWYIYNFDCIITYYTNANANLPLNEPFVPFYTYIQEMCSGKKVQLDKTRGVGDYIFIFVATCLGLFKVGYLSRRKP